jgi:hypothetical protein
MVAVASIGAVVLVGGTGVAAGESPQAARTMLATMSSTIILRCFDIEELLRSCEVLVGKKPTLEGFRLLRLERTLPLIGDVAHYCRVGAGSYARCGMEVTSFR